MPTRSAAQRARTTSDNVLPLPVPANQQAGHSGSRRASKGSTTIKATIRLRWVGLVVLLLLAGSVAGESYYLGTLAERVRSPLHPWLRPSGYIGQTAGLMALVIFLFLWLYPLRKKYRSLAWTGTIARWLDVHIAAALALPVIAAIHASWRFQGVIGLGFWSMMVVVLSGVVGRYLYVHIPRSASGLELSAEEIMAERKRLMAEVAEAIGRPVAQVEALLHADPTPREGLGVLETLRWMVRDDLTRWRSSRALKRLCAQSGTKTDATTVRRILSLARREMSLTQQARMLEATQRIFRYWHVAHRPFAIAGLAAVLIHVGVVVAMGATWFW